MACELVQWQANGDQNLTDLGYEVCGLVIVMWKESKKDAGSAAELRLCRVDSLCNLLPTLTYNQTGHLLTSSGEIAPSFGYSYCQLLPLPRLDSWLDGIKLALAPLDERSQRKPRMQ